MSTIVASLTPDDIQDVITKALKADLKQSKLIKRNAYQYDVCINTWVRMWSDHTIEGAHWLLQQINNNGFISTVRNCDKWASELIDAISTESIESLLESWARRGLTLAFHVNSILQSPQPERCDGWFARYRKSGQVYDIGEYSKFSIVLTLLRFPKRFTVIGDKKATGLAIDEFFSVDWQNRCYDFSTKSVYTFSHAQNVRRWVNIILNTKGRTYKKMIKKFSKTINSWGITYHVPSGTTAEGYRTAADKRAALLNAICPDIYFPSLWKEEVTVKKKTGLVNTLMGVPKTLDRRRVIAPENFKINNYGTQLLRDLEDCVASNKVDIGILHRQQWIHQELALEASKVENQGPMDLSTIDLSHASDSITKGFYRTIFPADLVRILDELLPSYTMYDGKIYKLHCMSTAGHPDTFFLECVGFLAIDCAGVEQACIHEDITLSDEQILKLCSTVGDDIMCPNFAYPYVVGLLETFNFTVNTSKSYTTPSLFRESCGMEAYNGEPINAFYWPRHSVSQAKADNKSVKTWDMETQESIFVDSVTSLVFLQRNLYYFFPDAAHYMATRLLREVPKLRTQTPSSNTHPNYLFGLEKPARERIMSKAPITAKVRDLSGGIPKNWAPTNHKVKIKHTVDGYTWETEFDLDYRKRSNPNYGKSRGWYYRSVVVEPETVTFVEKPVCTTHYKIPEGKVLPPQDEIDRLKYYLFLLNGPYYPDPIMELAGCSSPSQFTTDFLFGEPMFKWETRDVCVLD